MKNGIWGGARVFGLATLAAIATVACSDGGDGGAAPTNSDPCEAQYDAMVTRCNAPEADRAVSVGVCHDDQQGYRGIGCEDEYDAWLVCTTKSSYDCNADTGCESSQNGYFGCQSQAVLRTGCVRLTPHDAECSDASKPYAFSCLSSAPSSCAQISTAGAGLWCCPEL